MTLVAFLQAQNCSNYPASWRHAETAGDFLNAEYFQRIARTLEDARFHLAFFDDRLAMPDRYGDDPAESLRHGIRVVKIFLHISKKEQLRRFHEREENPYKRWKITDDDWRNRKKWNKYERAIDDMFENTSTRYAPWSPIAGERKWYARVSVCKTIADALESAK